MHGALQEIDRRNKIGVENGDDLASGGLQSVLQRSRLVALSIGPMNVFNGKSGGAVFVHQTLCKGMSVVGGIVQHLHLQQVVRIIHLAGLFEQPLHHVTFVEYGKLNGDARQFGEGLRRQIGRALAVFQISPDHFITMQPVAGKNDQNGEVRSQDRPIERLQMMNARERCFGEHLGQAIGGGTNHQHR
jgi:hypothetical protein